MHFVLIDFDLVSNFVGSHSSHGGDDDEECGGLLMSVSGQRKALVFSSVGGGDIGRVGVAWRTLCHSCLNNWKLGVRPSLQLE